MMRFALETGTGKLLANKETDYILVTVVTRGKCNYSSGRRP